MDHSYRTALHVALAALAGLAACGDALRSRRHDPTEREPLQYWCGWSPRAPRLGRLLVDLRLRSGDGNRRPSEADVRAVERRGGRVRHHFQVAVLRAVLDTAAVRALIDGPDPVAESATAVVDPEQFDVRAQVFFQRPITVEDERAVRAAGGRRLERAPPPVLYVVLPDSAIPRVARLPNVRFVRALAQGCATVGHAPAAERGAAADRAAGRQASRLAGPTRPRHLAAGVAALGG